MATARINNTKHIGAAIGHTASITPDVHAIPFPPLKLRKNGKLCPSTAPKPAYSSMHFGLSTKYYCHFTSPIRRYPDLQIHRIIKETLHNKFTTRRFSHYDAILPKVAEQSSKMERRAEEVEREVCKLKKAEYMRRRIGEVHEGIISGVTNWGIYVELPNTIEGMVHVSILPGDYYYYDEKTYSMVGERTGRTFKLGEKVKIRVKDVDMMLKNIDFELVEDDDYEQSEDGWKKTHCK